MKKSRFCALAVLGLGILAAGLATFAGVDVGSHLQALISPEAAMGLAGAGAAGTIKYRQRGVVMDWVNGSGGAVPTGKMVVIGTRVGIVLGAGASSTSSSLANGATGSAQVGGVFNYAKLSTDVIAQGALVYYDAVNDRLTTTSAGNTLAGFAFAAAGNGALTVDVCLNSIAG